jgi:hypothetical protein
MVVYRLKMCEADIGAIHIAEAWESVLLQLVGYLVLHSGRQASAVHVGIANMSRSSGLHRSPLQHIHIHSRSSAVVTYKAAITTKTNISAVVDRILLEQKVLYINRNMDVKRQLTDENIEKCRV